MFNLIDTKHLYFKYLLVTIGLSLAVTSVSCSRSSNIGEPLNVLNRGLNGAPESLDPHKFHSTQAAEVLRDIGEGLLRYSATGELVGGVASHWDTSEGGLRYIFYLRPEARWSNGQPVTANHFVLSFQRLIAPATGAPYPHLFSAITNSEAVSTGFMPPSSLGIAALDDHRLSISLSAPTPHILHLLAHPSTFPIFATSIEENFAQPDGEHQYVTNGAYKFEKRIVGSIIVLQRNKYYWDNRNTQIDSVNYHIVEEVAEVNRYRAGELDITGNVAPSLFPIIRLEIPDELHVSPYLAVYYYGFNLDRPPFSGNKILRRALSMAIDRTTLVKHVTGRGEEPAYGWVPSGVVNYSAQRFDYSQYSKSQRIKEARRLYRDAGYGPKNPLQFELRYNTSDVQQRIALAIQSMWRDVLGADVILVNEEFKVLLSNIREREITQMFRLSWTGDYNDPQAFLQIMESDNPSNMTGYSNKLVDDLMVRAGKTLDSAKRRQLLEYTERLVLNDQPVIPLYFYVSKHLVKPTVKGWTENVLNFHYSQHLELVQP